MQDFLSFIQQHWLPSTAIVIVFILLILVEYIRGKRGAQRVSAAELTRLINRQNAVVVDLRNKEAFLNGHIVGALSIPLSELEKSKKLDKFKSEPIVLVCAAGLESPKAATILAKNGKNNTFILAGGIRSWRDADMPLVKD